jgi:hypothetical protein
MQRVSATDYGFAIVFGGPLTREEAEELVEELRRKLPPPGGRFGVLVDSRQLRSYPPEVQQAFRRGILLCAERGMERSIVVLDSEISAQHAKRLGKATDTWAGTRYIDARTHPDWRRIAREWLLHGTEPGVP